MHRLIAEGTLESNPQVCADGRDHGTAPALEDLEISAFITMRATGCTHLNACDIGFTYNAPRFL